MLKSWFTSHKKVVIITAVLLSAAAGLCGWYFFSASHREPVYVYPFHFIGMTEYWGDSQESYGPVSTDKIQTVFLSETQDVTEIAVKEGDPVKKGDLLLQFDTTLSDLQLERKRLDVEKLKLQLQDAETKLYEINGLVPAEQIQVPDNSIYYDDDLGPMIHSQGFEICENTDYNGSSPYQPLILWLSQNQSLNHNILSELKTMAEYLQTMNSYTEQDDGSLLYQPVSVDSFCVVVRITENDQQFAGKTTWQGLRVNAADYSIRFFTPTVMDPMDTAADYFSPPEAGTTPHYTAAQIAQMRADAEKKIRDLAFQIKMAESEYKIMQKEVSDGNIYAEIDGEVVSLHVEEDDVVAAGSPLAVVMDMSRMEAEVLVDEYDAEALEIGREVSVTINALDVTVPGTIRSFSKQAVSMGTMSAYTASVELDVPEKALPGMQVEVKMLNEKAENALLLKVDALQFDEENEVYVLTKNEEGEYVQTYVETGVNDGSTVQIVSGLSEGETVYYAAGIDIVALMQAMRGGR